MSKYPKFSKGGKFYFDKGVWEFNLPAGHSCPYAHACKLKADRETGKIEKGNGVVFPCYAATCERYPAVREARWGNLEAMIWSARYKPSQMILDVMPEKAKLIRIHASGDFFSQWYFDTWLDIARARPDVRFWAFTKSLPFWIERKNEIPDNLALTASRGGLCDADIEPNGLRWCKVFQTRADAVAAGLPVDDDDRIPSTRGPNFALVLRSEVAKERKKSDVKGCK